MFDQFTLLAFLVMINDIKVQIDRCKTSVKYVEKCWVLGWPVRQLQGSCWIA